MDVCMVRSIWVINNCRSSSSASFGGRELSTNDTITDGALTVTFFMFEGKIMCDNRASLEFCFFFRWWIWSNPQIFHSTQIPPSPRKWYSIICLQTYHHVAEREKNDWVTLNKHTSRKQKEKQQTRGWQRILKWHDNSLLDCDMFIQFILKKFFKECFNQCIEWADYQFLSAQSRSIWSSVSPDIWQMRSIQMIQIRRIRMH